MYSRVKSGRLRSSGAYSGYESTVRNAKKASSRKKYHETYDDSSEGTVFATFLSAHFVDHLLESGDEAESEEEGLVDEGRPKRNRKPNPVDQNGDEDASNQEAPLGNRIKGRYVLRRIQPVERYQPIGTLIF